MKSYSQRRSQRQEKSAAADVGGRVQPGSGSMPFAKSDVRDMGKLRVECKTTSMSSYTLKLADLLKIRLEAVKGGLESWVFQIEFQNQTKLLSKLAVLDEPWFLDMGGRYTTELGIIVSGKSTKVVPSLRGCRSIAWAPHRFSLIPWTEFLDLYKKQTP